MSKRKLSTSPPNPPDGAVSPDLLAQLADMLWLPHDMSKAQRAARLQAARARLEDIAPGDGIEGMLAVQMIATHEASMACLHRATRGEASPELCDRNLKHAERLLGLYTRQMDVLGRHRMRQEQLEVRRNKERLDRDQQEEALKPMILTHYSVAPGGTRTLSSATLIVNKADGTRFLTKQIFPEEPEAAENDAAEAGAAPDDWTP